ncbi:hypothetical protein B0A48_18641 [Cryoendolithus antarcticus]|uniref:Ice-binding protein n=1 Tax=Cryoendolithus antarcticus TaxID=1507870 RepID=A0A1V8S8T8_9PEZI|nr:hypothetical protein B0A48_18641 [Cryoendolithus antarcticus]
MHFTNAVWFAIGLAASANAQLLPGLPPISLPIITTPIQLGLVGPYGVFAATTITNTGNTNIAAKIGLSPGTSITGFGPGISQGQDAGLLNLAATLAKADLLVAYASITLLSVGADLTGQDLGGRTLYSGVYQFSSSGGLTGQLILDAQNNPNAVFVFKFGSTLTTASASSVVLINGAQACNVYWQVGSSATFGTGTQFLGVVLAQASITATTGTSLSRGALYALNAAVTLDTVTIGGSCGAAVVVPPISVPIISTITLPPLTSIITLPPLTQTITLPPVISTIIVTVPVVTTIINGVTTTLPASTVTSTVTLPGVVTTTTAPGVITTTTLPGVVTTTTAPGQITTTTAVSTTTAPAVTVTSTSTSTVTNQASTTTITLTATQTVTQTVATSTTSTTATTTYCSTKTSTKTATPTACKRDAPLEIEKREAELERPEAAIEARAAKKTVTKTTVVQTTCAGKTSTKKTGPTKTAKVTKWNTKTYWSTKTTSSTVTSTKVPACTLKAKRDHVKMFA